MSPDTHLRIMRGKTFPFGEAVGTGLAPVRRARVDTTERKLA